MNACCLSLLSRGGLLRRLPAVFLLAVVSCFGPSEFEGGACPDGYAEVKVLSCGVAPLTKGSLLSGCEAASSGSFIAVYRSDDGVFEGAVDVEPGVTLLLQEGVAYDFFLVGNLNYIRRDDGRASNLRVALGADFPMHRDDLVAISYMLDGGNVGSTIWRRESSADVAVLGIPFSGIRTGVTVGELKAEGGLSFPDACYLFAKVELTVDHSRLDYGDEAAADWFLNMTLSVRQANARLYPFSSSLPCAESVADILGREEDPVDSCFDYDAAMVNGTQVTYTLYVPANAQGALLPGNVDSSLKTPESLEGAGKGEKAELCTYVEFTGAVSVVPGGYRGDLRYRFFLGQDSCSDFSVLPGRCYRVTLLPSVEGVFGAVWKVSGTLVDERSLQFFRDAARGSEMPFGGTLQLGAGRESHLFVRCDDGSGSDLFYTSSFDGAGWSPRALDDIGLRCSFWDASDGDAAWLAACGVEAVWDRARRCFVFSVVDESRFRVHCGERRLLEVYAVPGDGSCWRSLTLELVDYSSVAAGGFTFTVQPSYVGTHSVLRYERRETLVGAPTYVSVSVDDAYIGDFDLLDGGSADLGVLSEGEHQVDLELCGGLSASEWEELSAEVCAAPTVSVTYGQRSLQTTCWRNVRDADGRPYVAHRRSWGRIWVDFQPQGRWESFGVRMTGTAGSLYSMSGSVVDIVSVGFGEGEILLDFALGESVCTVSVPYVSYEEVVFRAAEEHGWLVLMTNNVSVGWDSLVNAQTGTLYAGVVWSLRLTLRCADGSSVSGSWGPFSDVSASVADGSRHMRDFHDEFRSLRQSFESGHRLQDAERLEGRMTFRVTFGSRFYLANVSGATFADFSGMVEGECTTPSAHPVLQHWGANSSRFYGFR